jgi:hypothetical protein
MSESLKVFRNIHKNNLWKGIASLSGSGSDNDQTRWLSRELPLLLKELKVSSLLDLPCGDMNWMKNVDLGDISYIGGDIVPEVISKNSYLASSNRRFEVLDITSSALPTVDAILCRDCLVHFPYSMIVDAIKNIVDSGAGFILTTHFTFRGINANQDIQLGSWRRLNFEIGPYRWGPPIRSIIEGCTEGHGFYSDKTISVWNIDQLRCWLSSI